VSNFETRMARWEYCKVDLGTIPRKATDIDLLNDLGKDGWELIKITPNSIAYLKSHLPVSARRTKPAAKQFEWA